MTWSLSARGDKQQVLDSVAQATAATDHDRAQLFGVKAFISAQVNMSPDGNEITVACSGHADAESAYTSVSFNTRKPQPPNPITDQ